MTHEFKKIVEQALINQKDGLNSILATVVHLDGSSYRKPGVRMLIDEHGRMTGAVSGGCVEKEIFRRSNSVFETGKSKIMAYDGRYRLGCEGILYILIERFIISDDCHRLLEEHFEMRKSFTINSYYEIGDELTGDFGSVIHFNSNTKLTFTEGVRQGSQLYVQEMKPVFRLLIFGGEHDSVALCKMAALLGWQVDIIHSIKDPKKLGDFPGAHTVTGHSPETIELGDLNEKTAVVIMNHSYVQDLRYLVRLYEHKVTYVGILGAANRRERLFNELFDFVPDVSEEFLESIYTPAGLNIGAETPEEIALSILAEIQTVIKEKDPFSLRKVTGKIDV